MLYISIKLKYKWGPSVVETYFSNDNIKPDPTNSHDVN